MEHIAVGVDRRNAKGTEFVPENFCGNFPHNMESEEAAGYVPDRWLTTAQLMDPQAPKDTRVKSGYTGHVPHGRDIIGTSYKKHDNRGTATKHQVPTMHPGPNGQYPVPIAPKKDVGYAVGKHGQKMLFHDVFTAKPPGDKRHEYGATTTAPVPMRVEKVLSGDATDMDDAANRASAFDMEGAGQWVMAGYTGHVPKAKEVYGTSYYGPPEGPSYHGPYYTSDVYAQPMGPNKEAICP